METTNKNYYQLSQIEISRIVRSGQRPTIALHSCCGPCSTFPLEFLYPYFDITILYPNPNIYPKEEYERRLSELKRYVDIFNNEHNQNIKVIEFEYDNDEYNNIFYQYYSQNEGEERCKMCYRLRMDRAYKYANEHHFDYFTTVMTISRQKSSQVMNQIGLELQMKYTTKYFLSDFKKKKGIDRSQELRKQYSLYNQLYCGCKISYEKFLLKQANKNNEKL